MIFKCHWLYGPKVKNMSIKWHKTVDSNICQKTAKGEKKDAF